MSWAASWRCLRMIGIPVDPEGGRKPDAGTTRADFISVIAKGRLGRSLPEPDGWARWAQWALRSGAASLEKQVIGAKDDGGETTSMRISWRPLFQGRRLSRA